MSKATITTVTTTELIGMNLTCGHEIWLPENILESRRKDGRKFYCTYCGRENWFPLENKNPSPDEIEKVAKMLGPKRD